MRAPPTRPSTFSVVAVDLDRKEWGVAVQSKFVSVGAVVPWARAGVGAIATQALANLGYGPDGLSLLQRGASAEDVVHKLTVSDKGRDDRQLGVVDAKGRAASYTGKKCMDWAGHVVGEGFACQGNILLSQDVVQAMAHAMESTPGDLAERLFAALTAGQKMGGDRRGQQSAALLVVKPGGGYGGTTDRYIDVRVDDHPTPIEELKRVFAIYDMCLLEREDPASLVKLEGEIVGEVQTDLKTLGFYFGPVNARWDGATNEAFSKFLGVSNFENKERKDGTAWPSVLGHLHARAREALEQASKAQRPVYRALSSGPGKLLTPAPAPSSAPREGPPPHRTSKKRP